ncbi:MAG: hypothetical protein QOF56_897 [Acidobacteriaceae bacterium]|nr:hypothetical protein [Acidobacteriaceae bacterium]
MATRRPAFVVPIAEFAAALLARPEVSPRAQVTAQQIAQLLPGTAVVVYIIEDLDNPAWTRKAVAGDVTVAQTIEFIAGTLGTVAEKKALVIFERADLQREDYAHLDIRRTVTSLAYVPLPSGCGFFRRHRADRLRSAVAGDNVGSGARDRRTRFSSHRRRPIL